MNLKDYLTQQSITMSQFAKATGCTQGFISLICNGKRRPSPEIAKQISDASNGKINIIDLLFPEKNTQ